MLYVLSNSFSPYFNLATEEYLLKNKTDDIFMLWRSEPSVIIGKHQNALAELNYSYCLENGITIARRLSGGGTVVHDLQNLNFTFISNGKEGKLIDFKRFVNPVIDYLATLNIDAYIGKTNDIRVGELKVSGNAEHVYRKRTLHHGTLLFNSDLNRLKQAIKVTPGKYIDKAVQSNRSGVTNIKNLSGKDLSIETFADELGTFIGNANQSIKYELSPEEIDIVNGLAEKKYKTDDWIWGYSPKYVFQNENQIEDWSLRIKLKVEKGVIKESSARLQADYTVEFPSLTGIPHRYNEIYHFLQKVELPSEIVDHIKQLSYLFF